MSKTNLISATKGSGENKENAEFPNAFTRVPGIFAELVLDQALHASPNTLGQPCTRQLDIGTGDGILFQKCISFLHEKESQDIPSLFVGIDLDVGKLRDAKTTTVDSRCSAYPPHFLQMDAHHLAFPDHTFNLLTCLFGIMYFHSLPDCLHEMKRVLVKSDGKVIITVWERLEHMDWLDKTLRLVAASHPVTPSQMHLDNLKHPLYDRDMLITGHPLVFAGSDGQRALTSSLIDVFDNVQTLSISLQTTLTCAAADLIEMRNSKIPYRMYEWHGLASRQGFLWVEEEIQRQAAKQSGGLPFVLEAKMYICRT